MQLRPASENRYLFVGGLSGDGSPHTKGGTFCYYALNTEYTHYGDYWVGSTYYFCDWIYISKVIYEGPFTVCMGGKHYANWSYNLKPGTFSILDWQMAGNTAFYQGSTYTQNNRE